MKEFGSDFHLVDNYNSGRAHLTDVFRDATLLADGRQCIVLLVRQYAWKRIWMPAYFCYEVIETIKKQTDIEIVFYPDFPLADDKEIIKNLPFKEGDVLLRMNYFSMRKHRSEKDIPVPVIEDHTHDLLGNWSLDSDADWCIASLRKSLPLPEGGMLWSPKGHQFSVQINRSETNQQMAEKRWQAMQMKQDYLYGSISDKNAFRKLYVETEEWLDTAELSLIDERSREYLSLFDINSWQEARRHNWRLLKSLISNKVHVVQPEDDSCTMFSMVLLADNQEQRDTIRSKLIEHAVYPAILWQIPDSTSKETRNFSRRMLSIHCDGRYNDDDIRQLAGIINKVIDS